MRETTLLLLVVHSSDRLTIRASQTIMKVELHTISGKKVTEFTPHLMEVDLNMHALFAGTYLVTIHSNKNTSRFELENNKNEPLFN